MIEVKDNNGSTRFYLLNEWNQNQLKYKLVSEGISARDIVFTMLENGSVRHVELMSSDYVKLKFSLYEPIMLKRGFRVEVDGRMYYLCNAYYPSYNQSNGGFDYDVQFDAWYYSWNRYLLKLNPKISANETTFDYTCRLGDHCKLIYDAVREYHDSDSSIVFPTMTFKVHLESGEIREYGYDTTSGAEVWSVISSTNETIDGTNKYVKDEAKVISYQGVHVTDALTTIAETFDCEWWLEENANNVVFHFGRCEHSDALSWALGDQMANMTRNDSSDEYATRIYAYGATTNIPARYRKKLIFTATHTNTFTISRTSYATTASATASMAENGKGMQEPVYMGHSEVSIGKVTLPYNGNNVIYGNIPYTAKFNKTGSLGSGGAMGTSYALIKGTQYELSFQTSGVTNEQTTNLIFNATINGTQGEEVEIKLSSRAIVFNDNVATADVTYGIGSITIKGDSTTYARLRDNTRKMLPSYFLNSCRQSDSVAHLVKTSSDDSSISSEGKSGASIFKFSSYKRGKYTFSYALPFNCSCGDSGEVEITMTAYTMKGAVSSSLHTLGLFQMVYSYGQWSCKTDGKLVDYNTSTKSGNIKDEMSIDLDADGELYVKVAWSKKGDTLTPSLNSIVIDVTPLNASCSTTLTPIIDGVEGTPIECTANIGKANDSDDEAQWLYFPISEQATLASLIGHQYKLTNVKEFKTPASFFTNDYDSDDTISGYQRRLMLPITYGEGYENILGEGKNYVQYNDLASSEVVEAEVVFDDIYPSKKVNIVRVDSFEKSEDETDDNGLTYSVKKTWFRFYLKKEDFNFDNEYISSQATLSCFFASGLLAGMTFELAFEGDSSIQVDGKATQTYVIQKTKIGNIDMPNNTLCPQVGNEIAMINYDPTALIDTGLIADAEKRLLKEAITYLDKVRKDCGTYSATMNSQYIYGLSSLPSVGTRVSLTHSGFFSEARVTRVLGFEHKLDIAYDAPTYTLGESSAYSRIGSLEKQLKEASHANSSTSITYITNNGSSTSGGSSGGGSGSGSSVDLSDIEDRLSKLEKGGGDKNFIFEQATASVKWTIEHSLGKYPSVTILDASGEEVVADVKHTDENTLEINFVEALSGKAILN